jgi:hypothetical protein
VVGYVDRYCGTTEVFFVLVVVVMLMAVQRIWRLRLGKLDAVETRWEIEWAWEVGEEPLTSPTVRATNRAIRMMYCMYCTAASDTGGMIMRASELLIPPKPVQRQL